VLKYVVLRSLSKMKSPNSISPAENPNCSESASIMSEIFKLLIFASLFTIKGFVISFFIQVFYNYLIYNIMFPKVKEKSNILSFFYFPFQNNFSTASFRLSTFTELNSACFSTSKIASKGALYSDIKQVY